MYYRFKSLVIKELLSFVSTPQGKQMLILPVLIQAVLFPFAATLEIRNVGLVVYNQDNSTASRELVHRIASISAFSKIYHSHSQQEFREIIEEQKALLGISILNDFSKKYYLNQNPKIQVILDGRRSNGSQIAFSYVNEVVQEFNGVPTDLSITNFYNPNLLFLWHLMPSLIAIIAAIGCLMVTGLSIAREKEEGTFDQLLVSPLPTYIIMFGKLIPGLIISIFQGSLLFFISLLFYNVPMTGSYIALYLGFILFGFSVVGLGLLVSSLCSTQQQAFLGVFSVLSPLILISGYLSPIENMPDLLQVIAYINPLSHFIILCKSVMLKSANIAVVFPQLFYLFLISSVSILGAYKIFSQYK